MSEEMRFPREVADRLWSDAVDRFEPNVDGDSQGLELKAHHEAGHIVGAWATGEATFGGAAILPYQRVDGRRAGGAALYFLGSNGRAPCIAEMVSTLAGPAAARRYDVRRDDGGTIDREEFERDLAAMCRAPEAAAIVRAHCETEARRIVDANWDAVEAMASALLSHETLDGDHVDDVLAGVMAARVNARAPAARRAWAASCAAAAEFQSQFTRIL